MMNRLTLICVLCLYFKVVFCAAPDNLGECAARMRECSANLEAAVGPAGATGGGLGLEDEGRKRARRAVCGTDNQTYPTACHLERATCQGAPVSIKHRGECKDACIVSRNYALSQKARRGYGSAFVPRCRPDGRYAPVQCLAGSGCWCVTPQGKAVPNTSVRTGRPQCTHRGKSNARRRSRQDNRARNKRGCSRSDKSQFNSNLIKIFRTEYLRAVPSGRLSPSPAQQALAALGGTPADEDPAIEWKFNVMDKNRDRKLDKNEYKELKRLVRKIVKPRRCARTFGRACDHDKDEHLSLSEWRNCLSKDVVNHDRSEASDGDKRGYNDRQGGGRVGANGGRLPGPLLVEEDDDDEEEFEEEEDEETSHGEPGVIRGTHYNIQKTKPALLLQGSVSRVIGGPSGAFGGMGENPRRLQEDTESDCLSDRAAVQDEQVNGSNVLYVPECTADGRYQRVQCYRSTGYCWCVSEDSGNPIAGTSTKDEKPQCDALPTPSRPMKGCPEDKKSIFLQDLMEFLKKQMSTATNGTNMQGSDSSRWMAPLDEQVATWNFVMLDKNKNKALDRREWKTFRVLISNSRLLRRCGKKFPRYCDANHDRRITLAEWLNCLHAERATPGSELRPKTHPGRKGPNPLEKILKDD